MDDAIPVHRMNRGLADGNRETEGTHTPHTISRNTCPMSFTLVSDLRGYNRSWMMIRSVLYSYTWSLSANSASSYRCVTDSRVESGGENDIFCIVYMGKVLGGPCMVAFRLAVRLVDKYCL